MRVERYNAEKRGSFKVALEFYDWELAVLVRAVREYKRKFQERRAYSTWLENLERKLSRGLGKVLRVEIRDLKLARVPELRQFLEEAPA